MLFETQPLSTALRDATRKAHSLAEQTSFIKGFLRGTASRKSYAQLLCDLQIVYCEMEEAITRLTKDRHTIISFFNIPELFRVTALRSDLVYLNTLERGLKPRPSSQAKLYATRIRSLSKEQPELLIAHIYTRYLGDLSGGQILSRIASRSMGLQENGHGLDFYDFGGRDEVIRLKQQLRKQLDVAGEALDADITAILDEANNAFYYNIKVFEHLEGQAWKSAFRNLPYLGRRPLSLAH